ncbi:nuclear transport factor 2 family protein [Microbacterium kribbense]|uniref:Nuclear transport factor 2 family protein n=1 Tax=Microbacterium kribbense TaxID=433645 RepID=A0ABP7GFL4_9MICO
MEDPRPPLPPFTRESAIEKVRLAENAWNTRDAERVAGGYSIDSRWRNRDQFVVGRPAIIEFLRGKWERELDYRLIKEMWLFDANRIAVRFAYESHDATGQWFRSFGNEYWEFNPDGRMQVRHASINDIPIAESDRKYHWDASGPRPADHPELRDLGL